MSRAKAHPPLYQLSAGAAADHGADLSLEALFRSHGSYIGAIALRILGRDAEVDDVVQEVFLAAMGALGRFYSEDAARGWLATVAVRTARRRPRLRRHQRLAGDDLVQPEQRAQAPEPQPAAGGCLLYTYPRPRD